MTLDLNAKHNQSVPAFKSGSNVVIEVLPWLVNQPWNALALRSMMPCTVKSEERAMVDMPMEVGCWDGFRIIESIVLLDKPRVQTQPVYQRALPPRKLNAVAEAVYEYTRLD